MNNLKPLKPVGYLLILTFLLLLSYAGYLSYKSIDWNVLKRLEAAPATVPNPITPLPASPTPIKQ